MSKKNSYWFYFIALCLLAAFLRFYKLGVVPHGMTWDEAAIGYNGMAIATTRRDEWLQPLPASFQSFGDYKAPLAIYLNGFFTAIFGMNLTAVRLPFALAGVAAVAGFMILVKEILGLVAVGKKKGITARQINLLSLASGFLLTLSPWHLHFSRAGFESGLSLALLVWGLVGFLVFTKQKQAQTSDLIWSVGFSFLGGVIWYLAALFYGSNIIAGKILLLMLAGGAVSYILGSLRTRTIFISSLSMVSLVFSIYTYHSAKLTVPMLVALVLILFKNNFAKHKRNLLSAAFLAGMLLRPMIMDSVFGEGLKRAGTLISPRELGFWPWLIEVVTQSLAHLSPSFLTLGGTTTLRHGDGIWGVLLPTTFVVFALGLFYFVSKILKKKIWHNHWMQKPFLLGLGWVFAGILPAGLGQEIPHGNRALLALPGFILIVTVMLLEIAAWLKTHRLDKKIIGTGGERGMLVKTTLAVGFVCHVLFFITYQRHYYTEFAAQSAVDFQDGYIEALEYAVDFEEGENNKPEAEKIIITSQYGQPQIYLLFVRQTSPIWYQGGAHIKYVFSDSIAASDLERPNTVVVAGDKDDVPHEKAERKIYGSDGELKFSIFVNAK